MKILRKRIGSLEIDDINKINIIEDSIFFDDKIIFNYLPIKNLPFFGLNLDKSNSGNKYWIFLDLNLRILFEKMIEGKVITNRDLIFEMIISSLNRMKILNYTNENVQINNVQISKIFDDENFKIENIFCFEKDFVKYGKIYFDINRRLITIDKCKKKRIKLPLYIIINDLFKLKTALITLIEKYNIENKESIFIISKKDKGIIESNIFNPYFNESVKTVIYSEDLNFQMSSYLTEIGNNDIFSQLEFESNNFYFKKKNIFILTNNLSDISINYISYCDYEKLFCLNFKNVKNLLLNLVTNYDKFRISKNDNYNNYLVSNFILEKRIFLFEYQNEINEKYLLESNDFPLTSWNRLSDIHFLNMEVSSRNITNFIKIGKKDNWSNCYINNLQNKIENVDEKCPISCTDLDTFSIVTECNHKFNLQPILEWLKENTECPVCRKVINLEKLKFINNPDISDFIKLLYNFEKKIIIVSDKLWYDKFLENKMFNKKKANIKLVNQIDFINGKFRKDKTNLKCFILNLSGLSDNDIIHINKHYKYINEVQMIELV